MGLNNKQEEKLAEILSNIGIVVFTAVIAGQFFPEVYFLGISRFLVRIIALAGALICWAVSIYIIGD